MIRARFFATIVAAVSTTMVTFDADAQTMNAKQFAEACLTVLAVDEADTFDPISYAQGLEKSEVFNFGYCTGMINGIVNISEFIRGLNAVPYCIPEDATVEDFVRVVTNHVARNPPAEDDSDLVGIVQAFFAAYPCSSN